MANKYNGFNDNKSPIHGVGGGKDLLSSSEEQDCINDLLKRRFKAIAIDTSENFLPGMIANLDVDPDGDGFIFFKETNTIVYYPGKYPHLFQELPWWSDREESEMQEVKYVKNEVGVYEVDEWEQDHEKEWFVWLKHDLGGAKDWYPDTCHNGPLFPATEAEYLNYQNSKQ